MASDRDRRLAYLLLGLGSVLRLARYWMRGSLWRDEAALALQVLGDPLGPETAVPPGPVPPGFLGAVRSMTELFGSGELALRAIPLLAGLLSLWFFYRLATRLLAPAGGLFALSIFALSEPLVFYSTELKPYSTDVLFAVGLLLSTLIACEAPSRRNLIGVAATGVLAIWFSFPALIVSAVCGMWLFSRLWPQCGPKALALLTPIGGLWALALFAFHGASMASDIGNDYFQSFWIRGFAPVPSGSLADLQWYSRTAIDLFSDPGGFRLVAIAALALLVGVAHWWQRRRPLLGLLLAVPILTLLLSMVRLYPFPTMEFQTYPYYGRLLLFLLPAVFLLQGSGASVFWTIKGKAFHYLGSLLLVAIVGDLASTALQRVLDAPPLHDAAPVLEAIARESQPGDLVLTQYGCASIYHYYSRRMELSLDTLHVREGSPQTLQRLDSGLGSLPAGTRLWHFALHHPYWPSREQQAEIEALLAPRASPLGQARAQDAVATLWQLEALEGAAPPEDESHPQDNPVDDE